MGLSACSRRQSPRRARVRASAREQVSAEGQHCRPCKVYRFTASTRGADYHFHRTCRVGNNSLIGSSTQIYENAVVTGSVLGTRCVVGPGARITHAYIFDDTTLGAGAIVERAIIGHRVSIGAGAQVPRGCLIGDGVVLGKGAHLRPFERVSVKDAEAPGAAEDSDDEEEELDDAGRGRPRASAHCSLLMNCDRDPGDFGRGLERAHMAQGTTS
jgi:NDP-sugar pyrophosphorylase family protein